MFNQLQQHATTEPLQRFSEYVSSTWITSSTWPPSSWCVIGQSVRTSNDVEGGNNDLNRRAQGRSNWPFYTMVQLLCEEARLASLQIRLVSEKKLRRHQRREYRELQSKIFQLWDSYKNELRTANQLLRVCAIFMAQSSNKFKNLAGRGLVLDIALCRSYTNTAPLGAIIPSKNYDQLYFNIKHSIYYCIILLDVLSRIDLRGSAIFSRERNLGRVQSALSPDFTRDWSRQDDLF